MSGPEKDFSPLTRYRDSLAELDEATLKKFLEDEIRFGTSEPTTTLDIPPGAKLPSMPTVHPITIEGDSVEE